MTKDIKRKNTKAHQLAKMAGDKRRKGRGVSRQEVIDKLGFDPAPYPLMYECFETVGRGRYVYTGKALD